MIRHLTLNELLQLYYRVVEQSGGSVEIHSIEALEAALAQPRMTFGANDLYPSIVEKAAALGFSLIRNHPFVDGNQSAAAVPFNAVRGSRPSRIDR